MYRLIIKPVFIRMIFFIAIVLGGSTAFAADLKSLAEQGDAGAQVSLGHNYYLGRDGAIVNYVEAAKWFRRAAEQGDAVAQLELGGMYKRNQGVVQDFAEAFRWYLKAAEQGYASAQHSLGEMYSSGSGVPQDKAEALRLYHEAAKQGYDLAFNSLSNIYETGKIVPKNIVLAHMWRNQAIIKGSLGQRWIDTLISLQGYLAEEMSPSQIAEAQKLARICLASNYKNC